MIKLSKNLIGNFVKILTIVLLILCVFNGLNSVDGANSNDLQIDNNEKFENIKNIENNTINNTSNSSTNNSVYNVSNDTKNNTNTSINETNKVNTNILTQNQIIKSSKALYAYIDKYYIIPKNVTVEKKEINTRNFLYLMSKTIIYKYKNLKNNITIKYNIKSQKCLNWDTINGKGYKKTYYSLAKSVVSYIDLHTQVPSYITLSNKLKIKYETLVYLFSKILATTKNNKLPNYVYVNVDKKDEINNNGKSLKLYNSYKNTDLSKYLKSTSFTPSQNSYIKNLAKKITKNCKTNQEKAEAIFNWTIKNIQYTFYYNTKYGGLKTIKLKKGNCVDMSHAYAALTRSVGIPTRYIHSRSYFRISGWLGHVWIQVLIKKTWIPVDISGSYNRFGGIVNWNQNKYIRQSIYSETPW